MGSESVDKLNQSNGENLFDKAVSMSLDNISRHFPSYKICEKTSLELLVYASEFDYKDINFLATDICKNMINIAGSLLSNSISRTPAYEDAYEDAYEKAHFKYAQLQVELLKSIYQTESYIHTLSYIKSICFSLELANHSQTYSLVLAPLHDLCTFKEVGLYGYCDSLCEDINLTDAYQHQGLIDAGLTKDDMRQIVISMIARDLKSIGATAEDIEILKEEV